MCPKKYLLCSFLVIVSLLDSLPIAAQVKTPETATLAVADLSFSSDPVQVFSDLRRSGRGGAFSQVLESIVGKEASDTEDALEAQSIYLFDQLVAGTTDSLEKTVAKSTEINRLRYEELRRKRQLPPAKRSAQDLETEKVTPSLFLPRSNYSAGNVFFTYASYSPVDAVRPNLRDAPRIQKFETDNSVGATGTETKVIESENATTTRNANITEKVSYDGEMMTKSSSTTEKVEVVSKIDRRKIIDDVKMEWSASFAICPDDHGIVRGKGKTRIFRQTTINTGTQLATTTTDYVTEFQITAHVDDSANMTHFDMEGVVSEKHFGYDRAVRLDLIKANPLMSDGSASVVYAITNSTPPSSMEPAGGGMTRNISPVLGTVKAKIFGVNTGEQVNRLTKAGRHGLQGIMLGLEPLMRSSISRWQNGECVDVECSAPKTSLKPNETIPVSAVSISKQDLGKFNANLKGGGTESVTPEVQDGSPQAIYELTGPSEGRASISVTSTSRRGIGWGLLYLPVAEPKKKPPVSKTPSKKEQCDGAWVGTVKAIRTENKDITGKPDGRLVRDVTVIRETYDVSINVMGTRDTTGGIVTNFHGNAAASFLRTDYRERTYAPGKTSCDRAIITTGQTQKYDNQLKGDANARIIVTISVIGSWGSIDFSPPEIQAESIISRIYESSCPSYNAANSSTERGNELIAISRSGFEVEFVVDAGSPNVIKGTKTVQNSDGSETTYSWDLSRCN